LCVVVINKNYHENRYAAIIHFEYAVVTCEMKLFQNYFSLRRGPSEIILSESNIFRNYSTGLLQLTNIFQHIQYR